LCASNLHGWGVGLSQRATDHKRKLYDTVLLAGGPFPVAINVTSPNTQYNSNDNEINVEDLDPYLQGYDRSTHTFSSIWACPSSGVDPVETWGFPQQRNHFHAQYSYFSGIGQCPADTAPFPDQITRGRLGENRLLMADTVYQWYDGSARALLYNHSDSGATPWVGGGQGGDLTHVIGVNRLYADGHTIWNGQMDGQKMNDLAQVHYDIAWVKDRPGSTPIGGMNFY
jgi:hypothetical protein